jgi:hypothetical protein
VVQKVAAAALLELGRVAHNDYADSYSEHVNASTLNALYDLAVQINDDGATVSIFKATLPMSRHTEGHLFKRGIAQNLASEHLRVIDNAKEGEVTTSRRWAQTQPWLATSFEMEMRTAVYGMECGRSGKSTQIFQTVQPLRPSVHSVGEEGNERGVRFQPVHP